MAAKQFALFPDGPLADRLDLFPSLRFMGSKFRLLTWISEVTADIHFGTVLDAFSGSGCVSYLFKSLGKAVTANDAMNFSVMIARALIENRKTTISPEDLRSLLSYDPHHLRFIEQTFDGIFSLSRICAFWIRCPGKCSNSMTDLRGRLRSQLWCAPA